MAKSVRLKIYARTMPTLIYKTMLDQQHFIMVRIATSIFSLVKNMRNIKTKMKSLFFIFHSQQFLVFEQLVFCRIFLLLIL